MRRVDPWRLFVGGRGAVRDLSAVGAAGIEAIVDVAAAEMPLAVGRELVYLRLPLMDGAGNDRRVLEAALGAVEMLIRADVAVLVVCSAGMSRAPSVAAGGLALATGRSAAECLAAVVRGGPCDVSRAMWDAVVGVLRERSGK